MTSLRALSKACEYSNGELRSLFQCQIVFLLRIVLEISEFTRPPIHDYVL